MRKAIWGSIFTAAAVLVGADNAAAQATATATVTVSATVNAKAKLTMGSTTASFSDADPDTSPVLSASAISVDVKARTSSAGSVTLTVIASDDLSNGSDAIGVGNLSWTVTGTNFAAGTMSKTVAQSLGSWTGGGTQSGTQTYKLANSWSYNTGSYSTTITYTLTAP